MGGWEAGSGEAGGAAGWGEGSVEARAGWEEAAVVAWVADGAAGLGAAAPGGEEATAVGCGSIKQLALGDHLT